MSGEEEVRLFGQPIRITVPGKNGKYLSYRDYPKVKVGDMLSGYALCDLKDTLSYSWREIFVEIDNKLYCMYDYIDINNRYKLAVGDYVIATQPEVTFERIHRMCIFLYNKLSDLQEQIDCKVDRREMD